MGTNTSGKKKIGLALSGGGWRGIAHIGVLKSLEKHGIQVDYIAGTSIGALVGGLYDYFGNADDLEKFFLNFGYRDLFKTTADPKLRNGLLNGKKLERYINQLTNNIMVEDLKIPYCAVASDMLSGESIYIKDGSLSEAIRTSISIPLVFQPIKKDGMCLIDGGASENVPVRCVKEMGADLVIGVYVNSAFFPVQEDEVNTSAKIAVVSARIMLNKMSESLLSEADIQIKPRITKKNSDTGIGYFLKFVKEKDLINTGEEVTELLISEIKDKLK